MEIEQSGLSPNQKAIKRLLKNKSALFGLVFIIMAVFVAISGYLITPDSTPDVNDQITEIALQPPGFQSEFLAIRKNRKLEAVSFFKKMIFGAVNPYYYVPITGYKLRGDSIHISVVSAGEQRDQGSEKRYNVADVIYPISAEKRQVVRRGDQLSFYNVDGKLQLESLTNITKAITGTQIYSRTFLLGTDHLGRCMFSRLIIGVRISLLVGLIAVIISLTIGIILGALAGYYGGRVDDLIMLLINTIWSIPTLLMVFAIVLALNNRGVSIIFIAVGLTMWVDVARIVRGQVLALKNVSFVEAAQSMGFGGWRIISKHILPNVLGPVMVIAAANFATAILLEAGLSYLGFGIQPPTPSWGNMLNENYGYAISGKPFLAFIPAFAIMLLVLAFNLVGNGFRDALDVKSKI